MSVRRQMSFTFSIGQLVGKEQSTAQLEALSASASYFGRGKSASRSPLHRYILAASSVLDPCSAMVDIRLALLALQHTQAPTLWLYYNLEKLLCPLDDPDVSYSRMLASVQWSIHKEAACLLVLFHPISLPIHDMPKLQKRFLKHWNSLDSNSR
eukprot:1147146-Pelagomonas_calceolata.AAC.14